jgi:5-methylcytosine-specific restriction protein B
MRDDIVPLLQEYCYEDYRMLADILGRDFVDAESQRLHVELFQEDKREELKQALLAMAPDMTTSTEAIDAEAEAEAAGEGADAAEDAEPDPAATESNLAAAETEQ